MTRDRRLPAHHLLEGLREEGTVGGQGVELDLVLEERVQQAARGAVGGLDAGRQQQAEEGDDLLVAQVGPLDLRPHEIADEVVPRSAPPLRHDVGEVVAQRGGGGHAAVPVGGHTGQLECPALEDRVVLAGQAQNAGDHLHGEIERHRAHQVRAPLVNEGVDQLVDDERHELLLPTLQHLGAEARRRRACGCSGARARPSAKWCGPSPCRRSRRRWRRSRSRCRAAPARPRRSRRR